MFGSAVLWLTYGGDGGLAVAGDIRICSILHLAQSSLIKNTGLSSGILRRKVATFRRKIPEAGETALRRRIQGGLKNN